MRKRHIDPWDWSDHAIQPATEIVGPTRTLYCSGLVAQAKMGAPPPPADMGGQIAAALDNVEHLLAEGGMKLADVVRLNLYTTDIDACMAAYDVLSARLTERGAKVVGCLLGVARLAAPGAMVEIEVTAVQ